MARLQPYITSLNKTVTALTMILHKLNQLVAAMATVAMAMPVIWPRSWNIGLMGHCAKLLNATEQIT